MEYSKHNTTKDGYRNHCNSCENARVRKKRKEDNTVFKRKDKKYYKKNATLIKERRKQYYQNNKPRIKARDKVRTAIMNGTLLRPNTCSECQESCVPNGHHDDYSKPLSVVWLCCRCHMRLHHMK